MKKFTKDEFNAIRNEIYSDLVIEKVMADTDSNFMYLDSVLGRHLEVDWMEINDDKIKLKAITIHWAEGDNSKYDKFPQSYSSYVATNDAIKHIYDDFINIKVVHIGLNPPTCLIINHLNICKTLLQSTRNFSTY